MNNAEILDSILNEDGDSLSSCENFPASLRRSIWLIQDEEIGDTYTADEILDEKPQDIIFDIRHSLYASYKSREYKYICKQCLQPVGLKIRTHEGDFFPFFSHFQNSGACPLKSQIEVDPIQSARNREMKFKSSSLFQMMIERLKEILYLTDSFSNIEENKIISKPEIKGYRKPALFSHFNEYEVCFDLLVSNPMISLLVGRNAFYKLHKIFYLWLFPSFTPEYQRLCQKDILYMNRRNVFVFDCKDFYSPEHKAFCGRNTNPPTHLYAYEESLRQKRLMLNCYWQVPEVSEVNCMTKISIKWEGPKLVAFDDLNFDSENSELYFHDSDVDFYNSYPVSIQRQIDEWLKIKKDRWVKIFDSIEKRKILYAQLMAKRERKERLAYYYSLIENDEAELEVYYDESSKLYGYTVDGFEVIPPMYYEAKPFYCGYAWVRKKERWGVIDVFNKRVINFQYSKLCELENGIFYVYKNQKYALVNFKGDSIGTTLFDEIEIIKSGLYKFGNIVVTGYDRGYTPGIGFYNYRRTKTLWGLLNYNGEEILPCRFDKIADFEDGKAKICLDYKTGYINESGEEEYEIIDKGGVIVYKSPIFGKYGLMDNHRNKLSQPIYDSIGDFVDGLAKVTISYGAYGIINKYGCLISGDIRYRDVRILFNGLYATYTDYNYTLRNINNNSLILNYDKIGVYNDAAIAVSKESRWGVINYSGEIIIPFEYSEIVDISSEYIAVKKNENSTEAQLDWNGNEIYSYRIFDEVIVYESKLLNKVGLMNVEHTPITGLEYDEISDFQNGKAKARIGSKWGFINIAGEIVIPIKYNSIGNFVNGKASARIQGNGFIDESGNEIYVYHDLEDIIICESRLLKKFGIMSVDRVPLTDITYDSMPKFKNDIAIVSINSKFGIINRQCVLVIPLDYDNLIETRNGNYIVKKDRKYGIVDKTGNILIPFNYDRIIEKKIGYYCVQKEAYGYWGLINDSNTLIIPIKYDIIGDITDGVISVRKGRWWKKITIRPSEASKASKELIDLSKIEDNVVYDAVTTGIIRAGVFIDIPNIGKGLIPAREILGTNKKLNEFKRGTKVKVQLLKKDPDNNRAKFKLAD